MGEYPRRAFCGLLAASAGALAGCTSMNPDSPGDSETVVTTQQELESAFSALSPYETIYITAENAPYRTSRWLDIGVDGVTVVGPGIADLIIPADGSNVGGIRIGRTRRCTDIDVRGIGYHGNPDGQSSSADRLHGINVRNAANVTLERNQIRRTHPQRHGDGGSGISVSRYCAGVQIRNNRIREFGDRGIQIGGKHHMIAGNVILNGTDRAIACDLWYPDNRNNTARNVLIYGNILGNTVEGSLVGIARNTPVASDGGNVSISGNLGFGAHKSFCHVRGPETLQNISIRNNLSAQQTDRLETEETTKFAGISVDVEEGQTLAIENNELYGYSGHGINVDSKLSDVSISNNSIFKPGLAGVRFVGGSDGLITGNRITDAGSTGIRLQEASNVVATNNYVRGAGAVGIVTRGSQGRTGTVIDSNYVTGNNRQSDASFPAIFVRDSGVRVRGNTIRQNGAPAIAEVDGVGDNLYEDNWADGDHPWQISSATSRIRDHTPPTGVYRDRSADAGSDTVRLNFDRPYARRPRITFGRRGGGVEDVVYETNEQGDFVGVEVTVRQPGAAVDIFVDEG